MKLSTQAQLQSPHFMEKESLKLANQILQQTNDYGRLREQYLSVIINEIAPKEIPSEIGLSEVPRFEHRVNLIPDKMLLLSNIDNLWHFISDQVELISSFKFYEGKVILSNNNRRRDGTYETPLILADALADMILTNFLKMNINENGNLDEKKVLDILKTINIMDPACGTGRLLFSIMNKIEEFVKDIIPTQSIADRMILRRDIIRDNINGVDKDPVAAIATRFLFWYSSLDEGGESLPDIRIGDSLTGGTFNDRNNINQTVTDSFSKVNSFNWKKEYPDIDGFDIVITNPPWEKLKIMTRELLDDIVCGSLSTKAEIDRVLGAKGNGHLKQSIEEERRLFADQALFFRNNGNYPLSSQGDLNLYALFTERCNSLLNHRGVAGLIVPTGIATDYHLRNLFFSFVDEYRLIEFHDFINKKRLFHNIDGRYRYSYLIFTKKPFTSYSIRASFYNLGPNSINESSFLLTKDQIIMLNPLTNTVIVPKSPDVIPLLIKIHKDMPLLGDEDGNTWKIKYSRQIDMTNDSQLFESPEDMNFDTSSPGILKRGPQIFLRVYEGKMVDRYNHRAGSSFTKPGIYKRSGYSIRPTLQELMDPAFLVRSRYVISLNNLDKNSRIKENLNSWYLVFKDITAATNRRTMRAAIIPKSVVTNKLPILKTNNAKDEACLLAILNSAIFDYICRQKIGNITLNWFILRQLPVPKLSSLHDGKVNGIGIVDWLVDRICKLTYNSYDLDEWSRAIGGPSKPLIWNDSFRNRLEAEIDSLMFHLYRVSPKDMRMVIKEFPQLDGAMIMDTYSQMQVSIP